MARFYSVYGGYHFHVMDRQTGCKALCVRQNVLYPADDFGGEASAKRYAGRLNKMVEKAARRGAPQEAQDLYWQYLD